MPSSDVWAPYFDCGQYLSRDGVANFWLSTHYVCLMARGFGIADFECLVLAFRYRKPQAPRPVATPSGPVRPDHGISKASSTSNRPETTTEVPLGDYIQQRPSGILLTLPLQGLLTSFKLPITYFGFGLSDWHDGSAACSTCVFQKAKYVIVSAVACKVQSHSTAEVIPWVRRSISRVFPGMNNF